MATLNRRNGKLISGFDEVLQSLEVLFTTSRGSRVMRREFGSDLPRLVDRSLSPLTLIDFYAAIAAAIRPEPRFRLASLSLAQDSDPANGSAVFDIQGLYYPRGHLGDFSQVQDARGRLVLY